MLWKWIIPYAAVIGILAGVGSFTFVYANGFSYFTTIPEACAHCHVMRDKLDSWEKSPHHADAVCVDCHLPHDLIGKYLAKALNGYHHSTAFTLQNFHEPIMIKTRNAAILQENCVRCHGKMTENIKPGDGAVQCVHCHKSSGHGPK